jgi:predicted 3'-5' exonuclease similar to PolB exonuclease domain
MLIRDDPFMRFPMADALLLRIANPFATGLLPLRQPEGWRMDALGAPHVGERPEAKLISDFVERIGQLRPQLITFNGHSFDLPVLRYRAMLNRVAAGGLQVRQYFHRYTEDALDLCDVLGSYVLGGKVKLDEVSKTLGLTGKPEGIEGSRVEEMVRAGQIEEVARYCESDVLNTYRVWLIYELFRGAITAKELDWSEAQIREFVASRSAARIARDRASQASQRPASSRQRPKIVALCPPASASLPDEGATQYKLETRRSLA